MPSFTVYRGSKDGSIKSTTTTKPDLTDDQVFVRVTASGLCFTDVHYRHADMGLGHEGAGVVEAVGPAVQKLKPGDRVGWGYLNNSCGQCQYCLTGRETYCLSREIYGEAEKNFDQGSFASGAVWRESYLFHIPDALSDAEAAPLMCGGATVWTAMQLYGVGPTSRVGIIGVGGLGHLAIQFVAKMGAEAIVFSGTNSKEDEARQLGASQFHATKGKSSIDEPQLQRSLDCLLITASAGVAMDLYLPLLAPTAKIIPLTVDDGDFKIPAMTLVLNGLTVQGSAVAPRHSHRDMLEFAARHGIKPTINQFPLNAEGIEKAFSTLGEGKMRYRGVLVPPRQ